MKNNEYKADAEESKSAKKRPMVESVELMREKTHSEVVERSIAKHAELIDKDSKHTTRIKTATEIARDKAAAKQEKTPISTEKKKAAPVAHQGSVDDVLKKVADKPAKAPAGIRAAVDRRITEQLILYWQSLRDGNHFPELYDVNPNDIAELWDDCFIVSLEGTHSFEYVGKNVGRIAGNNVTTEQATAFIDENLTSQYYRVLESKRPYVDDSEVKNLDGDLIQYRQILLPLGESDDEITVTHILGGIRFKIDGDET